MTETTNTTPPRRRGRPRLFDDRVTVPVCMERDRLRHYQQLAREQGRPVGEVLREKLEEAG